MIQLTKQSSDSEIKAYFIQVLNRAQAAAALQAAALPMVTAAMPKN